MLGWASHPARSQERGITPVVGTLLLIGITVAAVSVVAVVLRQMQPSARAPLVELGNIRAELIQADAENFVTRVSFTHRGGDLLNPRELRATINGVDSTGLERSTSIMSTSDNLITFGEDTSWALLNWQDFRTPRGSPYYENGREVEIFIIHDLTGTVLAEVTTEVKGPIYLVYSDAGIPKYGSPGAWEGGEVWTWDGSDWGLPPGEFEGNYTGELPPEGTKCYMTKSGSGGGNYAGWGLFLIYPDNHTIDLSRYTQLKFWIKTSANVKVEIEAPKGNTQSKWISNYGWDGTNTWQEIVIPASDFANLDQVWSPFKATIVGGDQTFYVDYVRWT